MSLVKEAIMAELQDAIKLSTEYKEKLDNAKTDIKAKTYKKKLKKNNQIIADMLIALDKLDKQDYNTQDNES